MSTNNTIKILGVALGICLIVIAVQSFYLWKLHQKLDSYQTRSIFDPWGPLPQLTDPWDPNDHFSEFHKRINELMNRAIPGSSLFSHSGMGLSTPTPKITMNENADQYEITVHVPEGQNVELTTDISGNTLSITGKIHHTDESKSGTAVSKSMTTSQFSQSMTLRYPVKESDIKMEQDDNNIVITIPKSKQYS